MPRRLGSSVPQTVSRLLRGGALSQAPAWFEAVGSVAPLRPSITRRIAQVGPIPSTSDPESKGQDPFAWQGSRKMGKKAVKSLRPKAPKPAPLAGFELYDKIRRQFYEDHKFEAFRGINLVEADEVVEDSSKPGPKGREWSELRQRSMNPSPEDTIDFILNLHNSHQIPVGLAYTAGVRQFKSLRASYEIMLQSAQAELRATGFKWPTEFSAIDRLERAEDRNLLSILDNPKRSRIASTTGVVVAGNTSRKSSLLEPVSVTGKSWTKGVEYLTDSRPVRISLDQTPQAEAASQRILGQPKRRSSAWPELRQKQEPVPVPV